MYRCFDVLEFGKYRSTNYSPHDTWTLGNLAFEEHLARMDESRSPPSIEVNSLLHEAHRLFDGAK